MKTGCTSQNDKKQRSIPLPVLPNSPPETEGVRHSGVSRWRAVSLIALHVLMAAHIIQWRLMGETITPIEPSESMFTLQRGAVNAGFIFFSLAILATLILGRFVCGWGCHVLALQDFCAWLMSKIGLKPRAFRSRLLIFVPLLVALYMFVWPTVLRLIAAPKNEPVIPQFTNHLITSNFWETFPPVWVAIPFLFICGFMTVYFLGSKGFCTYACPYGGFFGLADKVAPGRIRVTDACNQCGHCTATCTSNVIVHTEVNTYGMVVDPGCMKCMDCISVCPTDALYFGFGKPAIAVKKTVAKNYSLTWPEELAAAAIFFASFLAIWDVYQLVPMLMALGIATITTFVALRVWRLIVAKDLSLYRFNLKSGGSIRKAGWGFLAFALLWIGINTHSGWIHYHESAGAAAYETIRLPDELALAQANPAQWISPADKQVITAGRAHLQSARGFGLLENNAALPKLAWMEFLAGDAEQAVKLLDIAAAHQSGQTKALSLYYRGAILNRLGRHDQALISLDQALIERPDLVLAREEKGESLWRLGRNQEAVLAWTEAVKRSPNLPLTNNMLAGAASAVGKPDVAASLEKQAEQSTPPDALFYWVLGLRLQSVGMNALAEKHFNRAMQLNPSLRTRRN